MRCLTIRRWFWITLLAVCALDSPLASAQQADDAATEAAKFRLEVSRSKARLPLDTLQTKYDEALERLAKSEQAKGDLLSVLAIRDERKGFRKRSSEPEPSELAALGDMQKIYRDELAALRAEILADDLRSLDGFVTELEAAVKQLTSQGKVEAALRVKDEIRSARGEIDKLKAAEAPAPLGDTAMAAEELVVLPGDSFDRAGGIKVEESEGSFLLTGGGRVESRGKLKTPFTVQARVATDSTNIRLYFGQQGVLIMNWENNENELRLHEPVTGKQHGFGGKGKVVVGKLNDIEIRVTEDRVKIYANRRKLAEQKGDFADAQGKIGLGPAFGSKLTVESFKGIQQPSSEP